MRNQLCQLLCYRGSIVVLGILCLATLAIIVICCRSGLVAIAVISLTFASRELYIQIQALWKVYTHS